MKRRDGRGSIWDRIRYFFSVRYSRNQYLVEHNYFRSFKRGKGGALKERYPYIPYSLHDVIAAKQPTKLNVFVASHVSSAIWMALRDNKVTLGRSSRYSGHTDHINKINSYLDYSGDKLDLVIWDSHTVPASWKDFIEEHLSPSGVVIIVYGNFQIAMDIGMGRLGQYLIDRRMKSMRFQNPGPHTEIMTAEIFYPQNNVFDI